jgi:hypothetical protein
MCPACSTLFLLAALILIPLGRRIQTDRARALSWRLPTAPDMSAPPEVDRTTAR